MPSPKGGIEWLKRRLYSRTDVPEPRARRELHEESYEVPREWSHDDLERPSTEAAARSSESLVRLALVVSGVFFVLSVAVAAVLFFAGSNVVSADNIDIVISGPLAVPGGEELALQIEIINRNSVPLELADLIIEYPDSTRSPANLATPLPRLRESIGTIRPGERVTTTANAVLFGKEDTEQGILATLEYRIDGSNAVFYKDKEYQVLISSAPLAITVDSVKETASGQEVDLTVTVASNSQEPLPEVLVVGDFPFGFEMRSADPKPTYANNVWVLGDMPPGTQQVIKIRGAIVGQDNDERVFRFSGGTQDPQTPDILAATFDTAETSVNIRRPFIGLAVAVNGDAGTETVVTQRGQSVRVDIDWVNTLSSPVYDVEIEAKLQGSVLDRNQITTGDGFYRSQDDTVVWSSETAAELGEIRPGGRGNVGMTFFTKTLSIDPTLPNPTVTIDVSVKGRRLSESNVPEIIESTVVRTVRVSTDLQLAGRSVYTVGPFTNTGPLPPRVEQQTTYTIIWTVANTSNDIADARMTARLPSYVRWLGNVHPSDESLTYNPTGGEVVWNIGDVPARTGFEKAAREVAFQVAITPSLSQRGIAPVLVGSQRLTGVDRFTGAVLERTLRDLTTVLRGDPNFSYSQGEVVQ